MTDLNDIKRIDAKLSMVDSEGEEVSSRDIAIIFNRTRVSESEIREMLKDGTYVTDKRIIVTTPEQAENLKSRKFKVSRITERMLDND